MEALTRQHFLRLSDLSEQELRLLLDLAVEVKTTRSRASTRCEDERASLFEKPSTRTAGGEPGPHPAGCSSPYVLKSGRERRTHHEDRDP
jgi:ornithine carbamoyltransferase